MWRNKTMIMFTFVQYVRIACAKRTLIKIRIFYSIYGGQNCLTIYLQLILVMICFLDSMRPDDEIALLNAK